MKVIDVLKGMREVLAEPDHWTQGMLARTREGKKTLPRADNAFAFVYSGLWQK